MGKFRQHTVIGNKLYIAVKGGVWIYDFGDWCFRRFISNSWYANVKTDEL